MNIMNYMEICNICTDSFTKQVRKSVSCPKCQFKCCVKCLKLFLLTGNDPICMNPECKTILPDSFLYQVLPLHYINGEYKKKRSEVLLDREKSLLQSTIPFMKIRKQKQETENRIKELLSKSKEISKLITLERNKLHSLETGEENIKTDKSSYLKKCNKDGCKGYLNSKYKCELCGQMVCSKCFENKEENIEHICNPDNIKTAELLKKDTKPCPNCSELIHKIEGCNQMYCTLCHTGFDWNTCKIVTGTIHNPHFYEYQQQTGYIPRNNNDIPCGGLPNYVSIQEKLYDIYQIDKKKYNVRAYNGWFPRNYSNLLQKDMPIFYKYLTIFTIWHQAVAHIRNDELPKYIIGNPFQHNLNNRINYLMDQIDEQQLKYYIIKKHLENNLKQEIYQIYNTFTILLEDLFRNLMELKHTIEVEQLYNEIENIAIYINKCFQQLANRYQKPIPIIIYPNIDKPELNSRIDRVSYSKTKPIK